MDMFTSNIIYDVNMALHSKQQERDQVVLTKEDVEDIESSMGHCLVGRFLGRFLGWKALKELTRRWNAPHKQSLWLVFKFEKKECRDQVF